eukprot:6170587-Pleurochrysis_carterae.AAC.1
MQCKQSVTLLFGGNGISNSMGRSTPRKGVWMLHSKAFGFEGTVTTLQIREACLIMAKALTNARGPNKHLHDSTNRQLLGPFLPNLTVCIAQAVAGRLVKLLLAATAPVQVELEVDANGLRLLARAAIWVAI